MVDAPSAMLRSSRGSIYEARKSIHLGDGAELDIVPDLTNFRPVTLTVSSFFKQVWFSASHKRTAMLSCLHLSDHALGFHAKP